MKHDRMFLFKSKSHQFWHKFVGDFKPEDIQQRCEEIALALEQKHGEQFTYEER